MSLIETRPFELTSLELRPLLRNVDQTSARQKKDNFHNFHKTAIHSLKGSAGRSNSKSQAVRALTSRGHANPFHVILITCGLEFQITCLYPGSFQGFITLQPHGDTHKSNLKRNKNPNS